MSSSTKWTPQNPQRQATANNDAGRQQQQQEGGLWDSIQKVIIFYAIAQLAMKFFLPANKPAEPAMPKAQDAVTYDPNSMKTADGVPNPWLQEPHMVAPIWPLGTSLAVHVYVSQSYGYDLFSPSERRTNGHLPSVTWDNITWGDWNFERRLDFSVNIPQAVQKNGSLFAHVFVTKNGASPNPLDTNSYDPASTSHFLKLLSRYQPKLKVRKQKNLLSSSTKQQEEIVEEPEIIASHWHPNLTLALVSDTGPLAWPKLPPPIRKYVSVAPGKRDSTGTNGFYFPVVWPNDFWILKSQMQEINATTPTLPLTISLYPLSFTKFQILASLTTSFDEAAKQQGGATNAELDELKRMLTETNPYFLALTGIVSVLHMLFEFLAFKNDVQHWRNKKEMVGVSVRTIVTNVIVQGIILLYLMDNNENTSWMILLGQGTGMAIEAWKITKAVNVNLIPAPTGSLIPYQIKITDKHELSEDEKKTKEYDALAYRYVSYVAIPLLLGYSVYSLMYDSHRGWYSFIISTLTSFVYMFGFAQLVPQLIINYKLKSVSHMPFKAMIYKTLSTVVDDFFAFCIKMPLMHRLACFRDDVVFLIFLYQRHIYKVDHSRINEYGQVSERATEMKDDKESKKNK